MQNTITAGAVTFTVTNKNRPFGNNFVQTSARVAKYKGQDEIRAVVRCTSNSNEPGRHYSCFYSMQGELTSCSTAD